LTGMDLTVIKGTMPKRRVPKKELKAPDEVQTRLSRFVNFLFTHRRWIVGGVIAVLLVGAGVYLWQKRQLRLEEEASWLLSQALREEKVSQREAKLKEVISRYRGAPSASLALLFRARLRMGQKRWQEAQRDLEDLLGRSPPPPLETAAQCLLADVYRAQGKAEEAEAALERCQQRGKGWMEAYALLKKALYQESEGKKEEALKTYQEVLPMLPPGELSLFVRLKLQELRQD